MTITAISGSYSQPIIASRTPWISARLGIVPDRLKGWPPAIDAERLTRYEEYLALIEARHQDVFEDLRLKPDQRSKIALAVGLPELLCNVWADSVWSDPPDFEFPSVAVANRWEAIDRANDWTEAGAWESVFAAAAFGHSIVRLFRNEERAALGSDVVIEEIDPAIFFPTLKPRSSRDIDYVTLAWEEDRAEPWSEKTDLWQIREFHRLEDGRYVITREERRPRSSAMGGETEFREVMREQTDVDFLPFVDMHAKRWRGRYWGVSELTRATTLFDEVDNVVSNIAEILEYHGKPTLQVPASWIYGGVMAKGADKAYGVRRPEEADIARYITYEGMIDQQLASLDKVVELIMLTAEVPRTYFGLGDLGQAPSGTSLKLQLQNYVKKAGRWQAAETRRSRELVSMALRLDGQTVDLSKPIGVTHGSPLPVDDEQEARIEASLYAAGLSARATSIRKLRRVDDVDEEVALIEDEEKPEPGALPGFGAVPPARGLPGGVVNPNSPEPPAE
jgi:hypothetical protein